MAWSWKVGRVAGIPIYIHWTFLILIAWLLFAQVAQGHSAARAIEEVGFVLTLFGCVVLHELGHALAARRYGVPTADITLLPIGGVARLQRIPEHPRQELVVALAGPAVNVAIVAVLLLAGVPAPTGANDPRHLVDARFWPKLLTVNVFLVAFNLLPAFPMDGGRVLRALLALRMEYARATRLAASVGQVMAIGFGLLGLSSGNPMLLLIAMFVWIGAEAEASQVEERLILKGVTVREAMVTDFQALAPDDTLGRAADLLLSGSQHDFPVEDGPGFAGVLTRAELLAGLGQKGREARVGEVVATELPEVEAGAPLVPAVARLREQGLPCLRVVEGGRTVGLLTLENIGEYLMVRTALAGAPASRAGAELAQAGARG